MSDAFVSLLSGEDTISCGTQTSPCRTISYAIHLVSAGRTIYLDGTGTSWRRAYTCQPLTKEHQGIYVARNISFVSIGLRAHIACSQGNVWRVDGSASKGRIQVTLKGLAFRNSFFDFLDASVYVKDCIIRETKLPAFNFSIVNLDWFEITLDNVLFQQNVGCIVVNSNVTKKGNIFINIKDSAFKNNSDIDIVTSFSSILWLNCYNKDINMNMRNVRFAKNSLLKNEMIFINNEYGTTNTTLFEVQLVENGYPNTNIPNSLFSLKSCYMSVSIIFCQVLRSGRPILQLAGGIVQMSILNTEVEDFINFSSARKGVFDIDADHKCNILFINSSFRNGISTSVYGGVLSVLAPKSTTISIQNSIFQNVSNDENEGLGGALFISSYAAKALLNILNSSFLDNFSNQGGSIAVIGRVSFTVVNSTFMQNRAQHDGGSFYLLLSSESTVKVKSSSFIENNANVAGGAICVSLRHSGFMFSFVAAKVNFIRNKAAIGGAFGTPLLALSNSTIIFEKTRFVDNIAEYSGGSVSLKQLPINQETVHLVFGNCVFIGNYNIGNYRHATIHLEGRYNIVCQNSTFFSNSGALSLKLQESMLKISNTKFINNSRRDYGGGAIRIQANKIKAIITNSIFVNNTALDGTGGAISVLASTDKIKKTNCWDPLNPRSWIYLTSVEFRGVRFQGNIAKDGNVLYINNGLVILKDCLIMDNFGFPSRNQLVTYGSASLKLYNSNFKQTIEKITLLGKEYGYSSFLGMFSGGPLVIRTSTVDQRTNANEPLIVVSKTGLLEFDNSSTITCSLGSSLTKSDYSYVNSDLYGCAKPITVTVIRLFCQQCNRKSYSLQIGQSKGLNIKKDFVCTPCPYGAKCIFSIKSKDNFWGYQSGSHPPTLKFTRCPADYCKSPKPEGDTYNACQGKRTGIMCGTCSRGYTETLLSTHCKLVNECKPGWFWIALVALVFVTAFLLIFKPPMITFLVKQVLWFKTLSCRRSASQHCDNVIQALSAEEVRHENRQYSYFVEIIFYFYQISQLIIFSENPEPKEIPSLLGFFNFQFTISENTCPFEGLMPHTKKLFKIVPILATMAVIYIIYFFQYFFARVRHTLTPSIAPYLAASIRTLFLSYTVLATVGIQLIRCVSINGEVRWFYNGNVTCYEWWQYAAFAFNAIFVIPFIFILAWAAYKLHHKTITLRRLLIGFILPLPSLLSWCLSKMFSSEISNVEQNEKLNVLTKMLLTPFREPGALYWKSIMIARRFVLVLLFCVISDTSYKLFWMTLVCLLALFHHLKIKPFKRNWANNLESILLLLLVVLGFINMYKSVFVEEEALTPTNSFKLILWLEIFILGLFPASICILFFFAIISLFARLLYLCCGSLFRCLFGRGSPDQSRLLDVCENVYY